jgi:hypothetical protein
MKHEGAYEGMKARRRGIGMGGEWAKAVEHLEDVGERINMIQFMQELWIFNLRNI